MHMRDEWPTDSLLRCLSRWSNAKSDARCLKQNSKSLSPRAKTRVTIPLDSDMLRWSRKMVPGYGSRINQILRLYWLALLGGGITGIRMMTRSRGC